MIAKHQAGSGKRGLDFLHEFPHLRARSISSGCREADVWLVVGAAFARIAPTDIVTIYALILCTMNSWV
jgi:hypothetical protein